MASKQTSAYKISKKRSGRFMVEKRGGAGTINGEEKTKILQEAGLVKKMKSKPKEEAAPENAEA